MYYFKLFSSKSRWLRLAAVFAVAFAIVPAQAQTWPWAKGAGGTVDDRGLNIAVDASGNSYVTGSFQGSAGFDATTLVSAGGTDIFVVKYDAGGALVWAKAAGGAGADLGFGIVADAAGNIYVTGVFTGSAAFDATTLASAGSFDIFLAKYDPSGALMWAKSAGGSGADFGFGVAVDISGNSYVTGRFTGNATFDAVTLVDNGGGDIFVAKYDPSGMLVWAKGDGGTSLEQSNGVALEASGNIYVTGFFQGSSVFGVSAGLFDIFVAKYDASGTLVWSEAAGGTGSDIGNGIAMDASGNSYITGVFAGCATFGATTLISAGANDIFVAKYDASGSLLWAKAAGGVSADQGADLTVDASGNSFVTGAFAGSATFDTIILTGAGSNDLFVAKYDATGAVTWAKAAGGTGSDSGSSIVVDVSGNNYVKVAL
jgi:hypothetical protein